jgi:hypothetical protein
LDIPLAGGIHLRSSILEHWNEILEDEAEREFVFDGLKETSPLPLPAIQRWFVVPPMAWPKRDVSAEESR